MNSFFVVATTISAFVIAAAAAVSALELRQIRVLLDEYLFRGFSSGPPDDPEQLCPGHAIFICKDGQWVLVEDMSGPGFSALQPTLDPAYEGQVIRCGSIRNPQREKGHVDK